MNEETVKAISSRLLEERVRLGLTQTDMAKLGGYGIAAYHNYETARKLPELKYLFKASEKGLDLYYVIHGVRRVTGSAAEVASLQEKLERLPAKQKAALLAMVDSLLG